MKLIWFREDLRIQDNPALYYGALDDSIAAIYIFCEKFFKQHDISNNKFNFIYHGLLKLQEDLANLNIALHCISVDSLEDCGKTLIDYTKSLSAEAIYCNQQYEYNEAQRDDLIQQQCQQAGINFKMFNDQCLFEPGTIKNLQGDFFQVYTPFKKACWSKLVNHGYPAVLPAPKKQEKSIGSRSILPSQYNYYQVSTSLIPAGENVAHRLLEQFISQKIIQYKALRDFPAREATSRLSPYFASGMLTIRQCLVRVFEWNEYQQQKPWFELDTGALTWVNELLWREFYRHILVGFPRVCKHRAFKLDTEQLIWNDNSDFLERWQAGETGVPIVDAAMKQLLQTGWMHNRLRMVVAMFLSKNLFLDWRLGEQFFMQHLIDGDLASNNGGWQWSASTGVDAAPYFRIFNPYSQSERFDPQGEFIKKYLPQLQDLNEKDIHAPSPQMAKARSYPLLIVDIKQSRAEAIAAFKALS